MIISNKILFTNNISDGIYKLSMTNSSKLLLVSDDDDTIREIELLSDRLGILKDRIINVSTLSSNMESKWAYVDGDMLSSEINYKNYIINDFECKSILELMILYVLFTDNIIIVAPGEEFFSTIILSILPKIIYELTGWDGTDTPFKPSLYLLDVLLNNNIIDGREYLYNLDDVTELKDSDVIRLGIYLYIYSDSIEYTRRCINNLWYELKYNNGLINPFKFN